MPMMQSQRKRIAACLNRHEIRRTQTMGRLWDAFLNEKPGTWSGFALLRKKVDKWFQDGRDGIERGR